MDNFDAVLLQVIDETIGYCLGEVNSQIIYRYLEEKGCPKHEIPRKLDVFAETLEDLVGTGRGMILGGALILEKEIVEALCKKLGVEYSEVVGSGYFPEQCKKLKEIHHRKPKPR